MVIAKLHLTANCSRLNSNGMSTGISNRLIMLSLYMLQRYDGNGSNCQMEIVRIAKRGNSSTVRLTVELFPICAIR